MNENRLVKENMSIEEALAEHGSIVWNCKGQSMKPLIREALDYVVIERTDGDFKPYDVVLYAKEDAAHEATDSKKEYVLHRVIYKDGENYIILGDNCVTYEHVAADRIIGKMTGLIRNGHAYDFDSIGYRTYIRFWIKPYGPRVFLTRARNKLKREALKVKRGIKKSER